MTCSKCSGENAAGRKVLYRIAVNRLRADARIAARPTQPTQSFAGMRYFTSVKPRKSKKTVGVGATVLSNKLKQHSAEAPEGERKTVTALFADIKGSTS